MVRRDRIHLVGVFEDRESANRAVVRPGDISLIIRGEIARWMIMNCPDGCGEILAINLDRRTGKAWYVTLHRGKLSIIPSIWLDSGCRSHFIIWNSRIWWCSSRLAPKSNKDSIRSSVLATIRRHGPISHESVSEKTRIDAAEVLEAIFTLVDEGKVHEIVDAGVFYAD